MDLTIWTARSDDVTTVHGSRAEALARLRTDHADDNAPDDDTELVGWLRGVGFDIAVEEHPVPATTLRTMTERLTDTQHPHPAHS